MVAWVVAAVVDRYSLMKGNGHSDLLEWGRMEDSKEGSLLIVSIGVGMLVGRSSTHYYGHL